MAQKASLLTVETHDEKPTRSRPESARSSLPGSRRSSLQEIPDLAAALQTTSQVGKGAPENGNAEEEPYMGKTSPGSSPMPNLPAHKLRPDASPQKPVKARLKRSEASANDPTKLKYPIIATEPTSPRLVLSKHRSQAWQETVADACRVSEAALDNLAGRADGNVTAACEPPLEWYADELHRTCGQALLHTSHQIVSLQARHRACPALLGEKSLLRPLLFQAVSVVASVCYHVRRAVHALARKVDIGLGNRTLMAGSGRSQRRSIGGGPAPAPTGATPSTAGRSSILGRRAVNHGHLEESFMGAARGHGTDGLHSLPSPPFAPRDADDAFAALHLDVAQLQVDGQQLGVAIRRLSSTSAFAGTQKAEGTRRSVVAGLAVAMPVDELRRLLNAVESKSEARSPNKDEANSPNRLQQLFLALPSLEEAIEHLGALSYLIDNQQVLVKSQEQFDLLCSKRRDQEDLDAGIFNDSAGADMGFDDWDSPAFVKETVGNKLLDVVERARQNREAPNARPSSNGRPASAGRPTSASARWRRGVEHTSEATRGEGLQESTWRQSTETGVVEQTPTLPLARSTTAPVASARGSGETFSPLPFGASQSELEQSPSRRTEEAEPSKSASKRHGSSERTSRTPEKGKRKKGRG